MLFSVDNSPLLSILKEALSWQILVDDCRDRKQSSRVGSQCAIDDALENSKAIVTTNST